MKKVRLFIAIITITASYSLTAQVSITTDGSAPDSSAMLDVKSTDKGILIPRVALTGTTDETTITSPALSLMIYNTATAQDVIPRFYYWDSTAWTSVSKTADGSETKVTAGTNVTVTGIGTTASPYVVNASGAITYSVGDFALGGIVFTVDKTGQHGIVCAKEDQSNGVQWHQKGDDWVNTQAKGNGPYAGLANTAIIIALNYFLESENEMYAARICYELRITEGNKTYGDWYLPSKDELSLMYENKAIIDSTANKHGGFDFNYGGSGERNYWSSTERSSKNAWYQNFKYGMPASNAKDNKYSVRAVRAF